MSKVNYGARFAKTRKEDYLTGEAMEKFKAVHKLRMIQISSDKKLIS